MGISSIIITIMLFITLALVAAAVSAQGPLNDQAWQDYKLEYNKHYNADQELTKYAIWRKEVDNVNTHNAAFGNDFTTEINEFSDLTDAEFEEMYLSGLRVPEGPSNATMYVPTNDAIPNAVDWRTAGMVTPVKNQGQCGSCYSFSATGALEGAWKKAKGSLPSLSEQEIVDCSGRYGNYGCQGGWYQSSWRYLRDAGGDESESAYPYAVLAVGYGSEGGRDYYLVKNSWGTRWGAGGYIKMARNMRNNCGIATKASYPIV